jgi:dTDP-glucose 4,6-dehydratase
MRIAVTGGAGFIGTNLVRHLVKLGHQVVTFDKLTYAGNPANLKGLPEDQHFFVRGDVAEPEDVALMFTEYRPQAVMHLAAESHVDRSIESAADFVRTNVLGTQILLDAARKFEVDRFVHVSTDEVYGSLGKTGKFTEETPLAPNSPYAASKAASDLLVLAYVRTHKFNASVTRCSNNYGPYQFPEKLIPLFSTNAMDDKKLPLYGSGENVRDWIHVEDHCRALVAVLEKGVAERVYNIGGDCERSNVEITKMVLAALGKGEELIRYVDDRLGHDFRYAIDASRIETELGFKPLIDFDAGIAETIAWYRDHRDWWESIKSGEYLDYYETMYGDRLRRSK